MRPPGELDQRKAKAKLLEAASEEFAEKALDERVRSTWNRAEENLAAVI
jgi:hypothetical protein